MYQRKPGQCAIIANATLFEIQQDGSNLWMNNLYLRMQRDVDVIQEFYEVRVLNFNGNSAWLTNVTLQGDAGITQALYPFDNAKVYVQGMDSLQICLTA